jgi:ribonuclease R
VVTGVEDFGLFALGVAVPMEGLLHVRALPPDEYSYDRNAHVLQGRRAANTFRLGDRLECVLHRVDLANRTLDLRLAGRVQTEASPAPPRPRSPRPEPAKTRLGKKPKLPKGKRKRR